MMNKEQAKRLFVAQCYGDIHNLHEAVKKDRLMVQEDWSIFIDSLCRDGEITMQQYESWLFPWPKRNGGC